MLGVDAAEVFKSQEMARDSIVPVTHCFVLGDMVLKRKH